MLKKVLRLNGVYELSKIDLKSISGKTGDQTTQEIYTCFDHQGSFGACIDISGEGTTCFPNSIPQVATDR